LPYSVELRPSPDFAIDAALNKLTSLNSVFADQQARLLVPGDNLFQEDEVHIDDLDLSTRQGRLLQLSSWLNLDCTVSVGCAGAVVNYLQRKRASEYLQDDPDAQLAYRIVHLEMFTLKDTMSGHNSFPEHC
jgi:DNA mismatch repair protein MSH5